MTAYRKPTNRQKLLAKLATAKAYQFLADLSKKSVPVYGSPREVGSRYEPRIGGVDIRELIHSPCSMMQREARKQFEKRMLINVNYGHKYVENLAA